MIVLIYYYVFERFEGFEGITSSSLTNDKLQLTTNFRNPQFKNFQMIDSIKNINNKKNILIVDMPNWGGGVTFFINSIVSMYKNNVNFIIVRNFNSKLHVYINDEIKLNSVFDEKDSIQFLNNINHDIVKIFVNHTISHSTLFLEHLFKLNKNVTTITHDYLLFFKKPHILYDELVKTKLQRNIIDVNKYDSIITQNIKNIEIFGKFVTNSDKVIVKPLPDYAKPDKKIITNNKNIIVGIIGNISDIKGSDDLKKIIDMTRKTNNNIIVIVFGSTNFNYENQYKYNGISELNNLITKYKPNILIELSKSLETYSYTLTLYKIIGLPILYTSKNFPSVVEERLSNYSNAYKYTDINVLFNDIPSKSQNYLYTIEPTLYFNKYWDNYFRL
jgi:glycosyltransferase involved in cell wall biosynthesis